MQSYSRYLHHAGYLRHLQHVLGTKDNSTGRCPYITGKASGRCKSGTAKSIVSFLLPHHPALAFTPWLWCHPLVFQVSQIFACFQRKALKHCQTCDYRISVFASALKSTVSTNSCPLPPNHEDEETFTAPQRRWEVQLFTGSQKLPGDSILHKTSFLLQLATLTVILITIKRHY